MYCELGIRADLAVDCDGAAVLPRNDLDLREVRQRVRLSTKCASLRQPREPSRGLGRAIATGLAEAGAAVVLNGADAGRLASATSELRACAAAHRSRHATSIAQPFLDGTAKLYSGVVHQDIDGDALRIEIGKRGEDFRLVARWLSWTLRTGVA